MQKWWYTILHVEKIKKKKAYEILIIVNYGP